MAIGGFRFGNNTRLKWMFGTSYATPRCMCMCVLKFPYPVDCKLVKFKVHISGHSFGRPPLGLARNLCIRAMRTNVCIDFFFVGARVLCLRAVCVSSANVESSPFTRTKMPFPIYSSHERSENMQRPVQSQFDHDRIISLLFCQCV